MNNCFKILLIIFLLASCNSSEDLGITSFKSGKNTVAISLRAEKYFNPDGMVKRFISLESPGQETQEFELHTAHYSDVVHLKKLETPDHTYLIAEDKTGYTVWDFNKRKVIKKTEMEADAISQDLSGTATDYMTHAPLSKKQWIRVIGLGTKRDVNMVELVWQ